MDFEAPGRRNIFPREWGLAALVLAVACLTLGSPSLWLDEIMAFGAVRASSVGGMLRAIPPDKPPLDYLALRLVAGRSESTFAIRFASWGFFALTTAALALGARRVKSFQAVAFLPLLYASAEAPFSLGQQALPYSQMMWWLTLSIGGLAFWVRHRKVWMLIGAAAAGALACATAYTAIFPVIAATVAVAFALGAEKRFRAMAGAAGYLMVAAIPVIHFAVTKHTTNAPGTWGFPGVGAYALLVAEVLGMGGSSRWSEWVGFALGTALAALGLWSCRTGRLARGAAAFVATTIILVLAAFAWENRWLAGRYLLPLWLGWAVLQAAGLEALRPRPRLLAAALVLLGLTRADAIAHRRASMADHEGAVAKMREQGLAASDVILVDSDITAACLAYYLGRSDIAIPAEVVVYSKSESLQPLMLSGRERIFVYPEVFRYLPVAPEFREAAKRSPLPGRDGAALLYGSLGRTPERELPAVFAMEDSDRAFLLSGWYGTELWGEGTIRWTRAQASLLFHPSDDLPCRRVAVDILPMDLGKGENRTVILDVNGTKKSFSLAPGRFHRLELAVDVKPGTDILLRLSTSETIAADPNRGGDRRELSCAVNTIEFQP